MLMSMGHSSQLVIPWDYRGYAGLVLLVENATDYISLGRMYIS